MKKQDIPVLKQRVIELLPITQNEMWKTLGIGSEDGSDLAVLMLEDNIIKRTKIKGGSFLLERLNGNGRLKVTHPKPHIPEVVPTPEETILKLIKSRKKGILQNELWKKAEIDRRKCSRIIDKLEKEGAILRSPHISSGIKTFHITYAKKEKAPTKNFGPLLVNNMFSPCSGCTDECAPHLCGKLHMWVTA